MIATKKRLTNVLIFMFVFRASILLAQQQPAMVVFDANAFYVANPSSLNITPLIEAVPEPSTKIAENSVTSHAQPLKKRIKKAISTPKASTTAAVEKPIAQKTTVACPFGNYPSNSNSFYALHNSVGIIPPTTSRKIGTSYLQRRGEFHTSKKFTSKYFIQTSPPASPDLSGGEFSYLSNYLSSLWRELVPISREVRGEDITTRPPPTNC